MIIINGISYSTDKIILTDLFEGEQITLESNSSIVTWYLSKYPTTTDDQEMNFNSGTSTSTMNPEILNLDLVGTYVIRAVERNSNGNYSESKIYIRSNSYITNASLPFAGEKTEISSEGWSQEIIQYINTLTSLITPLLVTTISGGSAIYSGDETLLDGGDYNSIFSTIIDCGTSGITITTIDGGDAND